MKNLDKLYKECLKELDDINIKYGKIVSISSNNRLTRTWGRCKRFATYSQGEEYTFTIEISSRLLKDNVSDDATKNTIIHEILHTCKNCQNHGMQWQKMAEEVNKHYPKYNIKRTTSHTEKGISEEDEYKYVIECNLCHRKWKYRRKTRVVEQCKNIECPACHKYSLKLNIN